MIGEIRGDWRDRGSDGGLTCWRAKGHTRIKTRYMTDIPQPRDAYGHFVSRSTPPEDAIRTETQVKTPPGPPKNPLDEPLVSIQIQNPLKRLLYWLNDVRKKQTTIFEFKLKIPLIALPIFLAILGGAMQAMFSLGKSVEKKEVAAQPTPTPIVIVRPTLPPKPILISKLGTIKATYQMTGLLPSATPVILSEPSEAGRAEGSPSSTVIPPTYTPTPTKVPSRYVLIAGSQITFLVIPSSLSLNSYLNQKVLATGLFDQTKNTLEINKASDIELMP